LPTRTRLRAGFRRGQLAIIPDCGHMPHVERPGLFLEALDPFLAKLASASGSPS